MRPKRPEIPLEDLSHLNPPSGARVARALKARAAGRSVEQTQAVRERTAAAGRAKAGVKHSLHQ